MTEHYSFTSAVRVAGEFQKSWTQTEIKNEPMLFNCSVSFAMHEAGPITRAFLDALPPSWAEQSRDLIIDSRVHMLMPGWFACIPGWHHDDVARDASGQPNYDHQPYRSRHLLGLVNAEICPTVFAVGRHTLPKVSGTVYKAWHPLVEQQIRDGVLERREARSGLIYSFGWDTMHAGQRAVARGWRWFIRVTKRHHNHTNEIRNQVNVYLDSPFAGW